jgi:hypothetical protein
MASTVPPRNHPKYTDTDTFPACHFRADGMSRAEAGIQKTTPQPKNSKKSTKNLQFHKKYVIRN